MKSSHKNAINQLTPNKTPLSKRRLKTKPTLTLIVILLIGNLFWFILWMFSSGSAEVVNGGGDEPVAAVDGKEITRQEWMIAMESLHGKETLQTLVNNTVMEKAAKAYGIEVTEAEIELELALMRSAQDTTDTSFQQLSEEQLQQKVRAQLILEKVLTKDVILDESDIEEYYEVNQSLYNIPTTYRTSIIIVQSEEDAISVQQELEDGSEFPVLARERSIDNTSASLGGDIGYVTTNQTNLDAAIPKAVQNLDEGETSNLFVLQDGRFALVQVREIIDGQSFTYENVKDHIKRELAMEQLPSSITPEAFWKEFDATWFYGEQS